MQVRDLYEARNKKRISETDHGASKAKQQRLGRAAAQDEDQDGTAAEVLNGMSAGELATPMLAPPRPRRSRSPPAPRRSRSSPSRSRSGSPLRQQPVGSSLSSGNSRADESPTSLLLSFANGSWFFG